MTLFLNVLHASCNILKSMYTQENIRIMHKCTAIYAHITMFFISFFDNNTLKFHLIKFIITKYSYLQIFRVDEAEN